MNPKTRVVVCSAPWSTTSVGARCSKSNATDHSSLQGASSALNQTTNQPSLRPQPQSLQSVVAKATKAESLSRNTKTNLETVLGWLLPRTWIVTRARTHMAECGVICEKQCSDVHNELTDAAHTVIYLTVLHIKQHI